MDSTDEPAAPDATEDDELDVTEDEFDRMMSEAEPIEVSAVPRYHTWRLAAGFYTVTTLDQPAMTAPGPERTGAPRQQLSTRPALSSGA